MQIRTSIGRRAMRMAAHRSPGSARRRATATVTWLPTIRRFGCPGIAVRHRRVPIGSSATGALSGGRWTELFRAMPVTGRRPPAPGPPAQRGWGRGCVPRGMALATARLIFAAGRTSLLPVRAGSGRADRRPGRPVPFRRWHRIRAGMSIAEPRPPGRLWARGPPGRSCPGRQRAVPGAGSRPALPGCRAGEGRACRAVNMAHTTFPASPGVV